jgi:hypothetical protein
LAPIYQYRNPETDRERAGVTDATFTSTILRGAIR